jgi:NADH dehydrogenase [ubiquinone] 1 alpha subcomplex assembly factor 1
MSFSGRSVWCFPAVVISFSWASFSEAGEPGKLLFDFQKPNALEAWQTINDGVMGGVSEGNVRMTKDKTLEFFGNLSLENNGGFTSTRTRAGKLDLSQYEALVFKVRGDGRAYYFNIHVPTWQIAFSYRAKFATEKDKWQEIRIPLKDFRATSFGQEVSDAAPLGPNNIQAIGFLLSDKKAGPFKLEVAWIKGTAKQGK